MTAWAVLLWCQSKLGRPIVLGKRARGVVDSSLWARYRACVKNTRLVRELVVRSRRSRCSAERSRVRFVARAWAFVDYQVSRGSLRLPSKKLKSDLTETHIRSIARSRGPKALTS